MVFKKCIAETAIKAPSTKSSDELMTLAHDFNNKKAKNLTIPEGFIYKESIELISFSSSLSPFWRRTPMALLLLINKLLRETKTYLEN